MRLPSDSAEPGTLAVIALNVLLGLAIVSLEVLLAH